MNQRKYRKREQKIVIGVEINLETDGFRYNKWGGVQKCSAGDWLVNNGGACYTIGSENFAKTYTELQPGQFAKTAPVWASQADEAGKVKKNEGFTKYPRGDYIVCNNEDGTDVYAVEIIKFEEMYEEIIE